MMRSIGWRDRGSLENREDFCQVNFRSDSLLGDDR